MKTRNKILAAFFLLVGLFMVVGLFLLVGQIINDKDEPAVSPTKSPSIVPPVPKETAAPTPCVPLSNIAEISPTSAIAGQDVKISIRWTEGTGPVSLYIHAPFDAGGVEIQNPQEWTLIDWDRFDEPADYWFTIDAETCAGPRKYLFFIQVFPAPIEPTATPPFSCNGDFTECLQRVGKIIDTDYPQGYQGYQILYPPEGFLPTYGWERVDAVVLKNGIVYTPIMTVTDDGLVIFMQRVRGSASGRAGFYVEAGTVVTFVSYEMEYEPFDRDRLEFWRISAVYDNGTYQPVIEHWPAEK